MLRNFQNISVASNINWKKFSKETQHQDLDNQTVSKIYKNVSNQETTERNAFSKIWEEINESGNFVNLEFTRCIFTNS